MQHRQARVWIAALFLAAIIGTAGAQELLFPNSDFEAGDMTNWTIVSGTAWDANPVDATPWAAAPQGGFCVCSAIGAVETTVGVLRSVNFTVPVGRTTIAFYIAGWSNGYHRVDVHLASDDSVVASGQVPATNAAFSETSISGLGAHEGQDLYLTVHDENNNGDPDGAAGGWMALDNLHWAPLYEATGLTGNGNFETGDFTGWTTTGTAWGAAPVQGNGVTNGKEGAFFADSFLAGEPETGTLRSDNFEVTHNRLRFKMAGHPYWPPAAGDPTPAPWNWLVVRDAATDAELTPRMAPIGGGNNFADRELDLTSLIGQTVYIEAVDNADGSGYAWMCVDHFRLEDAALGTPGGINGNGNFEMGDYTNWTPSGTAFGTLPVQSNGHTQGKEQYYFAETLSQGETATGMLTSAPFTVTENTLAFLLAGWTDTPDGGGQKAWVSVRLAADDSEIARFQAPQTTSPFQERSVLLYDYMGQEVYVEIVDNNDNSGFGWLAADDFRLVDNPDMDSDGLSNEDELALGTDPLNPDTDGDGISDGDEVHVYGTDPLYTDTDGDGLNDYDEIFVYGTDPLNPDTDGDGILDGMEVAMGTNPLDPENRVPAVGTTALALGGLLLVLLSLFVIRQKKALSSAR